MSVISTLYLDDFTSQSELTTTYNIWFHVKKFSASDCKQRRPGAVFAKIVSTVKPEVIDKEYEAFISDLGGKNTTPKETKTAAAAAAATNNLSSSADYIPPMGSDLFEQRKTLMLTNGSAAPGAASAAARAKNMPQPHPGMASSLHVIGRSIFGGNMTKMTSGYKTKTEMEMEREKKKAELEHRPVPLEWQVERYEKSVNQKQEQYIEQLEQYCAGEKKRRQDR